MTNEDERIERIINEINEEIIILTLKRDMIYYTKDFNRVSKKIIKK